MMMQEWLTEGFPVQIPAGSSILDAEFQIPACASGLVILTHAGGASAAQRIMNLSEYFIRDGFGILAMNLLTEEEAQLGRGRDESGTDAGADSRFEASMLAERLDHALGWIRDYPEALGLPIGLFAEGAAAKAALSVAGLRSTEVATVVVSGLSGPVDMRLLGKIGPPTLLIADKADARDQELARKCLAALTCAKRLEFLPESPGGRSEPRAMERVSRLACTWFLEH